MAEKRKKDVNPQSQSIPGPTGQNPNEDVADGNQSTIQPGGQGDGTTTTGGTSVPSTGGNPAAGEGGTSGTQGGASSAGNQ
jgi:hypothetical protein